MADRVRLITLKARQVAMRQAEAPSALVRCSRLMQDRPRLAYTETHYEIDPDRKVSVAVVRVVDVEGRPLWTSPYWSVDMLKSANAIVDALETPGRPRERMLRDLEEGKI